MDKASNSYFVASDYDLTLRLQRLFHETVTLQTRHDNAGTKSERVELASRLKATHNEIALLVKEIKFLLSDMETVKSAIPLTLGSPKRSN